MNEHRKNLNLKMILIGSKFQVILSIEIFAPWGLPHAHPPMLTLH